MAEYPFEISPLAETFACEIKDVSLKHDLSEQMIAGLVKAIAYHGLILLRDQDLDADEQSRVTNDLGGLLDQSYHRWTLPPDPEAVPGKVSPIGRIPILNRGDLLYFQYGPGYCEGDEDPTAVVDEEDLDHKIASSCWHTGDSEKFNVDSINCLYAVIAPTRGGQTLYLDTTAAYEDLPEATRAELDQLRMIHRLHYPPSNEKFTFPPPTEPISQAVVKVHPVTGRKFLYLNFGDTDRVEGYSRQASYDLLKMLFDHVTQPRYRYAHTWRNGDFVLWNCNGTLHKRGRMFSGVPRVLRRTQAEIPVLKSVREWDKSRRVTLDDPELWHPYPFKRDAQLPA